MLRLFFYQHLSVDGTGLFKEHNSVMYSSSSISRMMSFLAR